MSLKVFDADYLDALSTAAKASPRQRQHRNIHRSYEEPCQRLLNAVGLSSYIRPHRHAVDPKDELLIAVRGLMALVIFDQMGTMIKVLRFGSEKYGQNLAVGFEVPPDTWHTVIALEGSCVLLEVKEGPFDPNQPKDLAPWAPEEDSLAAKNYLQEIRNHVINCYGEPHRSG